MNQVLSREEVTALLQGVAEAESDQKEPGQSKKSRGPDNPYKARDSRMVHRGYHAGFPR